MPEEQDHAHDVGRLIHYGLQPRARPSGNEEYRQLVTKFQREAAFEHAVRETARGLGLIILNADAHGLILAPTADSPFGTKPSEFRPGARGDTRIVDGLVQVAIAATVFPRRETLEEENVLARAPTTVDEIESTLRQVCTRLADEARSRNDPSTTEEEGGLIAAWRVYDRTLAARDTGDGRAAQNATRRIIETHLDKLVEQDCFLKDEKIDPVEYQPTWRYQVLVKELAATSVFEHAQRLVEGV